MYRIWWLHHLNFACLYFMHVHIFSSHCRTWKCFCERPYHIIFRLMGLNYIFIHSLGWSCSTVNNWICKFLTSKAWHKDPQRSLCWEHCSLCIFKVKFTLFAILLTMVLLTVRIDMCWPLSYGKLVFDSYCDCPKRDCKHY